MSQVNDNIPPLWELADAAFQLAMRRVIARAKQSGTPVIVWRDNQILRLSPDEVTVELDKKVASG
jgi:hypothetical protein